MKRLLAFSLVLTLLLALVAAVGGVMLWQEIAAQPQMTISVNGETLPIHELGVEDWFVVVMAGGFALLVVAIVVPLSLLLGLGLPLLIFAGLLTLGVLLFVGAGLLLAAPLLLPLLLLWWLLRRDRRTLQRQASGKPQAPPAAEPRVGL